MLPRVVGVAVSPLKTRVRSLPLKALKHRNFGDLGVWQLPLLPLANSGMLPTLGRPCNTCSSKDLLGGCVLPFLVIAMCSLSENHYASFQSAAE